MEALAKKKERQELEILEAKDNLAKLSKANPVKVTQAKIREGINTKLILCVIFHMVELDFITDKQQQGNIKRRKERV